MVSEEERHTAMRIKVYIQSFMGYGASRGTYGFEGVRV